MATRSEIARELRVSPAAITRWSRRGMPTHDLQAARAWHTSNIRSRRKRRDASPPVAVPIVAPAADPVGDPATRSWRDRLDAANARLREHELALAAGRTVDVQAVALAIGKREAMISARLKAMPDRVRALMHGRAPEPVQRAVVAEFSRLVNELLRDISIKMKVTP